jgi:hypothetical protein
MKNMAAISHQLLVLVFTSTCLLAIQEHNQLLDLIDATDATIFSDLVLLPDYFYFYVKTKIDHKNIHY